MQNIKKLDYVNNYADYVIAIMVPYSILLNSLIGIYLLISDNIHEETSDPMSLDVVQLISNKINI